MQDVKIIVSNHGHLAQCPESERQCPTCGQYHDLLNTVQLMEARMRKLEQKVCITLYIVSMFFLLFCIYIRKKTCTVSLASTDFASWHFKNKKAKKKTETKIETKQ